MYDILKLVYTSDFHRNFVIMLYVLIVVAIEVFLKFLYQFICLLNIIYSTNIVRICSYM